MSGRKNLVENSHFPKEGHSLTRNKRKSVYIFFAYHYNLDISVVCDKEGNIDENRNHIESEKELNSNKTDIDLNQLKLIYQQATNQVSNIQKTFNDLVTFHNEMINEKVKFIKEELPQLKQNIKGKRDQLSKLLLEEKSLISIINKMTLIFPYP